MTTPTPGVRRRRAQRVLEEDRIDLESVPASKAKPSPARKTGRARVPAEADVHFEQAEGGWWVASLLNTPGAYSQGRTRASAYSNLLDAIAGLEKASEEIKRRFGIKTKGLKTHPAKGKAKPSPAPVRTAKKGPRRKGVKLRTPKHTEKPWPWHWPSYRLRDKRAPDPPEWISVGIGWALRERVLVVADGDNANASRVQRARLGLSAKEPFEFNFSKNRPLKPAERRVAEDRQVLDRVAVLEAATVAELARAFLNAMSTTLSKHRVLVLDWGKDMSARRARLHVVLDRLCAAKLVRPVGRRWAITKPGYELIEWKRWDLHRRAMARKLGPDARKDGRT